MENGRPEPGREERESSQLEEIRARLRELNMSTYRVGQRMGELQSRLWGTNSEGPESTRLNQPDEEDSPAPEPVHSTLGDIQNELHDLQHDIEVIEIRLAVLEQL